jgi:hypothetical protein
MGRKFTNIKVGVELYSLLSRESLFQGAGYKGISACQEFMELVAWLSSQSKEYTAGIGREKIADLFNPYKINYKSACSVLDTLGILYKCQNGFYNKITKDGKVSRFKITDLGMCLLVDGQREYLRKLHNDPDEDRRVRNNRRLKKKRQKDVLGPVESIINNNLFDLEYSKEDFDNFWREKCAYFTPGEQFNINYSINRFLKGDFNEIVRNEKDGRIHHVWVLMKSDARPLFRLRGKPYSRILDIRACHPTFWASFVLDYLCKKKKDYILINSTVDIPINVISNIINNTISPTSYSLSPLGSLHYSYGNVDELVNEWSKWTTLWTNPDIDPRELIAQDLGKGETKETVKELVNSAMNGSENQVFKWICQNYPALSSIWLQTDLKLTGVQISKFYETRLILDPGIFELAAELGLDILPEHGGLGIFAAEGDPEIDKKARALAARIGDNCLRLFGFRVVVKAKAVGGGD